MAQDHYDVVIAGYGPTGLAAASLLARRRHKVCVFERWATLYGLPRMATIDGESVDHDVTGGYAQFFRDHEICGVLLRPDFVVFGVAQAPTELPGLVDSLRAQLEATARRG